MLRAEEEIENMTVKKITPVLLVEDVEACVKFLMERLGFEKTAEVPEGNELGFVILRKGNVELMYQSYVSADKDSAAISAVEAMPCMRSLKSSALEAFSSAVS